jgi:hypothetical protein
MKRIISIAVVLGILSQFTNPAVASVIKFGNLSITLPDSVTITGAEVGTGTRNCSFKVSVDADAGTTIPLRAMVVVNLVDALGTTIDNNYSQATVEGLTHQEFTGVFHCNASVGTLKPPYKFSGSVLGVPSSSLPFIEAPVTVSFVTATPTPSSTSAATDTQISSIQKAAEYNACQSRNTIASASATIANPNPKLEDCGPNPAIATATATPTPTKSSSQSDAQTLNLLNQYTPKVATLEKMKEQIQSWFIQYPNFFIANPTFKVGLHKALDYKVVLAPTQNDVDGLVVLLLGDASEQGLLPLKTQVEALIAKQVAQDLAATKISQKTQTTIICVKGKLTKKITSNKPVCPPGYKRK